MNNFSDEIQKPTVLDEITTRKILEIFQQSNPVEKANVLNIFLKDYPLQREIDYTLSKAVKTLPIVLRGILSGQELLQVLDGTHEDY